MSVAATVAPHTKAAKASRYIRRLLDMAKERPNTGVVIYGRESSPGQAGHMEAQIDSCHAAIRRQGLTAHRTFQAIGRANSTQARRILRKAVKSAAKLGAIVLAESTNRFIRSDAFHPVTNRRAQPSKAEFDQLKRLTNGVTLATVHDPDLSPEQEHGRQTARGMTAGKRGGRPKRRRYKSKVDRLKDQPIALTLREAGWTLGDIAKELGRAKSTVQYWVAINR